MNGEMDIGETRDSSGSPTAMKVFFAFTARRYRLKRF